jgi:cell division protein ZapA (FtsZ GTPase activity inhibitor)
MKKDLLQSIVVSISGENYELNLSEDTEANIEDLSDNLSKQPGLLAYYGELKVKAQANVNDIKATLDLFMAEERNKVRASTEGKRLYKDDLNDLIIVKEEFSILSQELRNAEHVLDQVSAAYTAVRDRGMALNSMASIYKAEMFVNDKVMEETFKERRKKAYSQRQTTTA